MENSQKMVTDSVTFLFMELEQVKSIVLWGKYDREIPL